MSKDDVSAMDAALVEFKQELVAIENLAKELAKAMDAPAYGTYS